MGTWASTMRAQRSLTGLLALACKILKCYVSG